MGIKNKFDIIIMPEYIKESLNAIGVSLSDLVVETDRAKTDSNVYSKLYKTLSKISIYDIKDMVILNQFFYSNVLNIDLNGSNSELLELFRYMLKEKGILISESEKLEILKLFKVEDGKVINKYNLENNFICKYETHEQTLFVIPYNGFSDLLLNGNLSIDDNINFNEWFIDNINDYMFKTIRKDKFYNSLLFKRLTRLKINKLLNKDI